MPETINDRYIRWGLGPLLDKYPELRVAPSGGAGLTVAGELSFRAQGPVGEPIEDVYAVEIRVPHAFPLSPPTVYERGGRIPGTFHKLDGGALCLGAPAALRLGLGPHSTLTDFVERFVVPYLFGFSYFALHGVMPFGELAHGNDGIRQHFASVFAAPDAAAAEEFVRLASLKRRRANKEPCPCRSGLRLGRCHHLRVNALRDRLGRLWFREQHSQLREKI